jgi:hypothetical protein
MVKGNYLWLGTGDEGIIKVNKSTYDFENAETLKKSNGLISDNINQIESAFGKIYVATDLGLSIINNNEIENKEEIKGVNLSNCKVILDTDIMLIIGVNENGGVIKYNGNIFEKIYFYEDEIVNIADVFISKTDVWFITKNATIYKIQKDFLGSTTEWEIIEPPEELADTFFELKKIFIDNRNILWIITDKELIYYDGENYTREKISDLQNIKVSDIAISKGDFKYLATPSGVVVYINSRTRKLDVSSGLSSNNVNAVYAKDDELFMATDSGLDLLIISSLERDRIECLSCHSTGKNNEKYETTDSEFLGVGSILENPEVKSGHAITYNPELDLSLPENNECIKCHGRLHPDENVIVVNVDNGTGYKKNDSKREFCLSCHDFAFENDELVLAHQLKNIIPQDIAEYYNVSGHGANATLSEDEAFVANNDCIDCHDHHSSKNAHIITKEVEYSANGDEIQKASNIEYFCKTRCHSVTESESRRVRDHTWELNKEEERDHTGCPKQPCETHPSNGPIPVGRLYKYPSEKLPLSEYNKEEGINLGFMVCITCHNPHGSSPDGEPNPDKQMVRMEWTEFNKLCSECHI